MEYSVAVIVMVWTKITYLLQVQCTQWTSEWIVSSEWAKFAERMRNI